MFQKQGLHEIEESFSEVPKFYVELQKKELRSLDVLCDIGSKIFGDFNPDEVLFEKDIYITDKEASNLRIYLPFAEKDELLLEQRENELIVGIKNERRRFPVPEEFKEKDVGGASFEDGYLIIKFV